jgi:hypothetical protein
MAGYRHFYVPQIKALADVCSMFPVFFRIELVKVTKAMNWVIASNSARCGETTKGVFDLFTLSSEAGPTQKV